MGEDAAVPHCQPGEPKKPSPNPAMPAAVHRPSLTRQLVVPLALLSLALTTAMLGLGWWQMTRQLESQLLQRARIIARTVSFSAGSADSREEMSRLNHMLVSGGDVELTALVGMDPKRLMITSTARWQGRLVDALLADEIDPRAVDALQAHRDYAGLNRPLARFYYVGPLEIDRPPPLRDAQVLVVLNVRPLQEQIAGSLQMLFAGLALLGLLGLTGFAWLVRARVIRPLSTLAEVFSRSDADAPAPEPNRRAAREIAALGEALTTVFGQVRDLNRDLEQRVRDRTAELVASLDRERELGRLRTNFIGMVSHEYRNSLATILSSAQIMERYRDRLPEAERARHLGQITGSCARLASLVEDVLLYSRSESGRIEVRFGPIDLAAVCRAEVAEAARQAGDGAGRLVFSGEAEGAAMSDEQLLHHVLSNLLGNALKYSSSDRPVELQLRREGEAAVFTVRDRGIGIPADELPRLGEAFRRGRNAAEYPGSGLGLVMVRRCLDLLGGTLELASVAGQGTVATVTVPVFRAVENGGEA